MVSPYNTDAEPGALISSSIDFTQPFHRSTRPDVVYTSQHFPHASHSNHLWLVHSPTQKQRIHPNIPPHSKIYIHLFHFIPRIKIKSTIL